MIFRNIQDIQYSFLKDAATKLSKKFTLYRIYMDPRGGISITFEGKLSENSLKYIFTIINPWESKPNDYELSALDYSYSDDMQRTYVYSADGIDYRNLV